MSIIYQSKEELDIAAVKYEAMDDEEAARSIAQQMKVDLPLVYLAPVLGPREFFLGVLPDGRQFTITIDIIGGVSEHPTGRFDRYNDIGLLGHDIVELEYPIFLARQRAATAKNNS